MVNQIFITIILLIFLSIEIYCLGKKIAQTNSLFINNESAIWLLGVIIYFGITFLVFWPFVWLNINIIYFIIIFILKDFIIFAFVFLGKERIIFKQVNFKNLLFTILISVAIMFFYNFVFYKSDISINNNNDFYFQFSKMWLKTQEIFTTITSINQQFISDWLIGFIGSTVIFATIHSLMIRFGKKQSWFEYFLSSLLSFGLISVFNFKLSIGALFPVYLTMFALFLALNIIQFARKRYSFVFIINFLVTWVINYQLFIALAAISLATAIVYSIMKKPMASLFWVQLLTPVLVVLISLLSNLSLTLTFILILLIFILYCALIFIGQNRFLLKTNQIIIKYTKFFLGFSIVIILILAILLIMFRQIHFSQIIEEKSIIFNLEFLNLSEYMIEILKIIQWISYGLVIILLIWIVCFWKKHHYKFVGMRIIVLVILTVFSLFFNPVFNTILIAIKLDTNFKYLRAITFMPLICFSVIWAHNWLINRQLIAT